MLVAALVLAINFAPAPGKLVPALCLGAVALAAGALFVLRQRRATPPLYDLRVAARPTFWVAACAGIIVFGSLMGAIDIAQRYPAYEAQITAAAKAAFLAGDRWAYLAGIVAVLAGAALVLLRFPDKRREAELLRAYQT